MVAARKKRAHQVAAKALLKAVSDLHPDEALEALDPFYQRERSGTRRRALRAARISLMRRALEVPSRVILPVVEAVPEPEPEPVVATEPPPPKPMPKGKMLSVSLEDAAKLLMVPAEPEPAAPVAEPPAAAEAAPEFAPMDWAAAAAGLAALEMPEEAGVEAEDMPILMVAPAPAPVIEMMDGAAAEAAPGDVAEDRAVLTEGAAAGPAPAKRGKKAAKAALPDLSAQFAAMEGDGIAPPPPARGNPLPPELDAELRALEGIESLPPVRPTLGIDPAAAFAALAGEETPAPRPATLPMLDPAAAFAAMEEIGTATPAAKAPAAGVMADPAAAFAALAAAEDDEARSAAQVAGKPKPLAIDLSAQFAAMSGDDEAKAG